jgi:hypothetical protein
VGKAYAASLGEQVHIAAWPLYPGKETLKYPDPYTNVAEANADAVIVCHGASVNEPVSIAYAGVTS